MNELLSTESQEIRETVTRQGSDIKKPRFLWKQSKKGRKTTKDLRLLIFSLVCFL